MSSLDSCASLLLASCCKLIEFFSCDTPLIADVLSGDTHVVIVECIPQSVIYHGVDHGRIVHTVSVTSLHQSIRSCGHVLCTTSYYDVSIACKDHICCCVYSIQTRTANHVQGNCRNFYRKTSFQRHLTCYVLTKASLDNTSHVYVINLLRSNACSLQSLLDNYGTHLSCWNSTELATHGTYCGTACTCNYDFLRH